jgi:hypothetical protein
MVPLVAKHVIRLYTTARSSRGVLSFGEEKVADHPLVVMGCVQNLSD